MTAKTKKTLAILILALIAIFFLTRLNRWDTTPPEITLTSPFDHVGRNTPLKIQISDNRSGLRQARVSIQQGSRSWELLSQNFQGPTLLGSSSHAPLEKIIEITPDTLAELKLQQKTATLIVTASDFSLWHPWQGNSIGMNHDFFVDYYPPLIEVLSRFHHVNQGGSEMVIYRLSEDAVSSGVQVGENFFPGYKLPEGYSPDWFTFFAFSWNQKPSTPIRIKAYDEAGNEAIVKFDYRIFPKKFRSRKINITDNFMEKVVPEILSHTVEIKDKGNLLDSFIERNSTLRKIDDEKLREIAKDSEQAFLWEGPFLQLKGSGVEAYFADTRTYLYKGKKIDRQTHLGFDLASFRNYPVEASNTGKVLFADYFDIYGNTIILDHGFSLMTLYGHLSQINVEKGQIVKKGEIIGKSGATGLAGGDHLHFTVLINGIPVTPMDWWSKKWVHDRITRKLQDVKK